MRKKKKNGKVSFSFSELKHVLRFLYLSAVGF